MEPSADKFYNEVSPVNQNRAQRQIILKEIQHWKESKLLPAEYCDFLMNLYTEGDPLPPSGQQKPTGRSSGGRTGSFGGRQALRITGILMLLLLFLLFVFNFTMFPVPMQIGLVLLGALFAYVMAYKKGGDNSLTRTVWLAIGAVLVALGGFVYLNNTGEIENRSSILATMALVFLAWTISGWIGRSRMITGGGWAGVLLIFAAVLENANMGDVSYVNQHLYWLLPAFFSLFLAYLFGRGGVYVAPVFLFLGILALFGPDIRTVVYQVQTDFLIQGLIFMKLAVLVSLLIVYRSQIKKWTDELSV